MSKPAKYVIAISGASGSLYGKNAILALLNNGAQVHVIISSVAKQVWQHELKESFNQFVSELPSDLKDNLHLENNSDLGARMASGSFRHDGMLIIPCSVKCLAGIAAGYAGTLIERAADVSLKEKFPLTLVIRETPFNLIHVENMARLIKAGATVLPASPAFYHDDITVDGLVNFVVGKAFDSIGIESHNLFKRWKSEST